MIWFWGSVGFWLAAWAFNAWLARQKVARGRAVRLFIPALFGVTLLILWEGVVRGLKVTVEPGADVLGVFVFVPPAGGHQ